MSHGDRVDELPAGFTATAATDTIPYAAMSDESRRFYGVQFHPEVTHTTQGSRLLSASYERSRDAMLCGASAISSRTRPTVSASRSARAMFC